MQKKVELLAPAGGYETMVGAFNAGADAVYLGGSKFGARAYADNFDTQQVLDAIRYAHLHGKRIYMTVNTLVKRNGKATESTTTPYGICAPSWPLTRNDGDHRFLLNGKPIFINGTCEYEHLFGQSHAFSQEQIEARIKWVKDARRSPAPQPALPGTYRQRGPAVVAAILGTYMV